MRLPKIVWSFLLLTVTVSAQKPPSLNGFLGNQIDYYALTGGGYPNGDTYYFTAWANDSMKPLFPDPAGLPIIGWPNDGTTATSGCSGWVNMVQLVKLPGLFTAPTTGNTLIKPYTGCLGMQGYGGGWNKELTGPANIDSLGTWKGPGGGGAFRNNRLLMSMYRQNSPGTVWGDATLIISPDAGNTFIDYGTYDTYAITGASCTGTTATLTAANALSPGQLIYVHDVTPAAYNGKQTLTAATASTVSYTVSACPGAASVFGAFGLLQGAGIIPKGPGDASYPGSMMWTVSGGHNPMTWQIVINYGQDGNFAAAGAESVCNPSVYVCGYGSDRVADRGSGVMILWRVPVGQEMKKSAYQFYTCPGYNGNWPSPETVCDGNQAGAWTSAIAGAASLRRHSDVGYQDGGDCYTIKYLESHQAYVMSCSEGYASPTGHFAFLWAPHPWGPWYPLSYTTELATPANWYAFSSLMDFGETKISATPPKTQVRISNMTVQNYHNPNGTPAFAGVEFGSGRLPPLGMARRADFLNILQAGMGHRFCSGGGYTGCIPRSGTTPAGTAYRLDWWVDGMDFAGQNYTYKPMLRDVVSNGVKYFAAYTGTASVGFASTFHPVSTGVNIDTLPGSPANTRLVSSWPDTVMTGNASYSFMAVINITHPQSSGCLNGSTVAAAGHELPIYSMGTAGVGATTSLQLDCGQLILRNGGAGPSTNGYYILGITFVPNTWYFVAVTVKAEVSGTPTVKMYIVNSNSWVIGGGDDMHAAVSGTVLSGLTKFCTASPACTLTPAVTSQPIVLGNDASVGEGLNGTLGEAALYSGALPENVIRQIYRSVKADWTRTGRGVL